MSSERLLGWEPVGELPAERASTGGAFRSAPKRVLAARTAASPRERTAIFLRSTPEYPRGRFGNRVVVTAEHLYIQRMDGEISRIARASVRGHKMDRGVLVYVMAEGEENLALIPRISCPVTRALEAQLRGKDDEKLEPYVERSGLGVSLVIAIPTLVSAALVLQALIQEPGRHQFHGARTFAAIFFAVLAGVLILFGTRRVHIDELGVHLTRGIIPLMHTVEPKETFSAVAISTGLRDENGVVYGQGVRLVRKTGGGLHLRGGLSQTQAYVLATRVAALLDLEVT